jgi:hypothetical protein
MQWDKFCHDGFHEKKKNGVQKDLSYRVDRNLVLYHYAPVGPWADSGQGKKNEIGAKIWTEK